LPLIPDALQHANAAVQSRDLVPHTHE